MELPDSVAALAERLGGTGAIAIDPQLLHGADVFAAERDRLFMRPWVAVDHQTRLDADSRFFRFDAATRSILVTRAADGHLHALRNVCIHAGYPVCEAEEGPAERLVCPYHGWEFTADGRLVEPDLSARIDPARLRLASHPVRVRDGLIFVDLSASATPGTTVSGAAASGETAVSPNPEGAAPAWLAEAVVTRRARYSIEWNWKLALQFVKSRADLFADEPDCGNGDGWVEFGPLSLMLAQDRQAALLRVIPKSAARTELQLIRMEPRDAPSSPPAAEGEDRVAEGLRLAGDADAAALAVALDRRFFTWYWSLMSAGMSAGMAAG